MKKEELFDALTGIDDKLILEAHETPVSRHGHHTGGLRRIAVMAAVFTTLALTTVAVAAKLAENDSPLPGLSKKNYIWYSTEQYGYQWSNDRVCYRVDTLTYETNAFGNPQSFSSSYSADSVYVRFDSDGESLRLKLEEMILMDNGKVEYKEITAEGADTVIAALDNSVDDKAGTIVHVRFTFAVLRDEQWKQLQQITQYLPSVLDLDIPIGTDVRFPDMKYNYDGRAEPEESICVQDTYPEETNPVTVIKEPKT